MRGYGGLQKFLVARRGASDTSSRLDIAEDGARVAIARIQAAPPPAGEASSSQQENAADDIPDETTVSSVVVEQDCSGGCLGTNAGAVTAGVAGTAVSKGHSSKFDQQESSVVGRPLPLAACTPVPAATSSVTLSLPGASHDGATVTDGNQHPAFQTAMGEQSDGAKTRIGGVAKSRRLPEQGPLTFECMSGVKLVCGDIFQETW